MLRNSSGSGMRLSLASASNWRCWKKNTNLTPTKGRYPQDDRRRKKKKMIRIADTSKAGWVTIQHLEKSGSKDISAEENKRVFAAEEQ